MSSVAVEWTLQASRAELERYDNFTQQSVPRDPMIPYTSFRKLPSSRSRFARCLRCASLFTLAFSVLVLLLSTPSLVLFSYAFSFYHYYFFLLRYPADICTRVCVCLRRSLRGAMVRRVNVPVISPFIS